MSRKRGTYDSVVSASSAEEAIQIAAEGVPKGAHLTFSDALDASKTHGPDSWHVTIKFKRPEPEGDY
ncbi:MAG: hypothetical protein ACE363_05835 [Alphaproteobacteria bacterium]